LVYCTNKEINEERGSGVAHEYYDLSYDVTWLVKHNVCLICCMCDENETGMVYMSK